MVEGTNPELCSICYREFHEYGNNADPINLGRCCDPCNGLGVFARVGRMQAIETHGYANVDLMTGLKELA